jgi:hypothetical protein
MEGCMGEKKTYLFFVNLKTSQIISSSSSRLDNA